jgi:preprotein translocase subunit SecA
MEAKILSNQIEGAQKKVEEQNFVMRKNVLKYDDVMNTQRQVIYEQRRKVLHGEDMSEEIYAWIDEVVARTVAEYTGGDYPEEWDLEELVKAMEAAYGVVDITVEELREDLSQLSREGLVEDFTEDARDVYARKEEELGTELMRELERFVILQVVDQRWREHLENMDYLREGIHLRGMAQKDPLVEYRGEGHAMFEELGHAIREEVVVTMFHVQLAPEDAAQLQQAGPNGGGPNGNLTYEHETAAGADVIAAAGSGAAGSVATAAAMGGGGAVATGQVVKSARDNIGRNDPCWCGSGKKFKKCHGA